MHFDFTSLKGLKITPSDEKKKKTERGESKKRKIREWREKERLTFLLIFISSSLEMVTGEEKNA